jgi:cobalt-zinc-cadmium efflux system membrane fusion protein
MKHQSTSTIVMVVVLSVIGAGLVALTVYLGDRKATAAPASPAPATTTRATSESELNVITLTPDAERRLDIQTASVEQKSVRRSRILGGEVIVPPGRAVTMTAPITGTIKLATAEAPPLTAGSPLKAGQAVFVLMPLLTADARTTLAASLADAEGLVKNTEVQLKAAATALDRVKQLVADQAGSQRMLDEAQAQFDLAQKALEAAKARQEVLARAIQGAADGSAPPIAIASPSAGVLRNLSATPGQIVSAGAPLFEVVDLSTVWVRLSLYAGDAASIAWDRPVTVSPLGSARESGSDKTPRLAQPVSAPPSANPLTSTVDFFYELANTTSALRPGEKVTIAVSLGAIDQSLVVPWSSITIDVHGGQWIYERVAAHAYVRRRVEVLNVDGTTAVLAHGPPVGSIIATQGVAELFGREMGFAK